MVSFVVVHGSALLAGNYSGLPFPKGSTSSKRQM
jgi:hypothetical protein